MNRKILILLILLIFVPFVTASNITINTNKTMSIEGKLTFPIIMYHYCNQYINSQFLDGMTQPPCSQSILNLTNFSIGIGSSTFASGIGNSWWTKNNPLFESNNVYWSSVVGNSGNTTFKNNYRNNSHFFGYYNCEEPSTASDWNTCVSNYNSTHSNDPDHPVFFPTLRNMTQSATVSDIIFYDGYRHGKGAAWMNYDMQDFIYAKEHDIYNSFIRGGCPTCTGLENISKPAITLGEAWGKIAQENTVTWYPLSLDESRADTYNLLTIGFDGVAWYGYASGSISANVMFGFMGNATQIAQYNTLAGEIRGLEPILLMPTINYSWGNYHTDSKVSFSNNPSKTVRSKIRPYLGWMFKQNNTASYLFVVNKDANSTNTSINISGLTGPMIAKTLGTQTSGSSRAGRNIPVINGVFTDSFDGYAVHVYEISLEKASPRYDVNENGIVDMNDMTLIYQQFNTVVSIPYPRYDVNMDGLVNIHDITITGQHFDENT